MDQHSDQKPDKKPDKKPARPRKSSKPVMILLNVMIAGLILSGLYLILKPYYLHWQQDRKTAELIDAFQEGDGTIVLREDELEVPGEEVEFIEAMETWDEDPGNPTSGTVPNPSGTGGPGDPAATVPTDPSSATSGTGAATAATTVKSTPKPTPKPVVIKAVGQIIIDKIGLTMPIADRAETAQLRVAVGLLGGSALPGTPGNTIILGHRMYTYGRHFNRLDEVVTGDKIVIVTKERRLTYEVERQSVILPTELRTALSVYTTEKRLILVTCTPVRVASHRLLVYARLVSDTPV
jgi:sortase A